MKYNPQTHHRRSIRLKGYDYSWEGAYFITICCHDRKQFFGRINNRKMILTAFGKIAHTQWEQLPKRFPNIELDEFQIMPNHMHGIIVITNVGASLADAHDSHVESSLADAHDSHVESSLADAPVAGAQNAGESLTHDDAQTKRVRVERARARRAPTVGEMIGAYKSIVTDKCLELWKSKRPDEMVGKLWQRNFFEHIIRDEQSFNNIRKYIVCNPENWESDSEYSQP